MTPYFSSFQEFLHMGGLGVYVWTCYVAVFVAVLGLIVYAKAERKRVIAKLNRHIQGQGSRSEKLTNKQRQALAKN